jgi:hypothetical protein
MVKCPQYIQAVTVINKSGQNVDADVTFDSGHTEHHVIPSGDN